MVFMKVNREVCNSISNYLAVFNGILSITIVYHVANVDSGTVNERKFVISSSTNFDPFCINLDVINISNELKFMMEDGRKSASKILHGYKVSVKVNYWLVPDLIPFCWCKVRGRVLSKCIESNFM